MTQINKDKLDLLHTIINDYSRVNDKIVESYGKESTTNIKSLISAFEGLKIALEEVLTSIYGRRKMTVKEEIEFEKKNSPMILFIKDNKGLYRKYEKISYYGRNIIYGTLYYKLDIVHFTYNELIKKIKDGEILEK